jgi:hypothetical protein
MENQNHQIFIDDSGSTCNVSFYWDNVKQIVTKYPSAEFYLWSDSCISTTYKNVMEYINKKSGRGGGTYPDCFINQIQNSMNKLTIITDGQIDHLSVLKCDSQLQNRFKQIKSPNKTYCFVLGDSHGIDASVIAPFIRYGKYKIKLSSTKFEDIPVQTSGDSSIKVDLEKYKTVQEFFQDSDKLYTTICAQNIGRGNQTLRNDFINMKTKFLKEFVKNQSSIVKFDMLDISEVLKSDLPIEKHINSLKEISDFYFSDTEFPIKLEQEINRFLVICDSVGQYSSQLLNTGRGQRAKTVDMDSLGLECLASEMETTSIADFECPITFLEDIPVLWFKKLDSAFLSKAEKFQVERITDCPICLLWYPNLVDQLVTCLEQPVGLKTAVRLETSPFSRQEMGTIIPLSVCLDEKIQQQYIKIGNSGLFSWLSNGKVLGNPTLWLVVIWYIIKTDKRLEFLNSNIEFLTIFEKHLSNRLASQTTYLGLSSLIGSPLIKTPISIAIAYVLYSGFCYIDEPKKDRSRQFLGKPMKALVLCAKQILQFKLDYVKLTERLQVLHCVSWLLKQFQDGGIHGEKAQQIKRKIRAAVNQRYLVLPYLEEIILLDGQHKDQNDGNGFQEPYQLEFPLYKTEPVIIWNLLDRIDPSFTFGSIQIPFDYNKDIPKPLNFYNLQENDSRINDEKVICPATLRPFSVVNNVSWDVVSEKIFGPLSGQISLCRYYIRFIEEKKEFPEMKKEEFISFCYKLVQNRENSPKQTLPRTITRAVNTIFKQYAIAYQYCYPSIDNVCDVLKKSQNISDRRKIEEDFLKNKK